MSRTTNGSGLRLAAALSLTLAVAAGCAGKDASTNPGPLDGLSREIPDEAPSISGTITIVQPGDSVLRTGSGQPNGSVSCPPDCGSSGTPMRRLLIEEVPGGSGDNKSSVSVPATALLLKEEPSGVVRIGFADLRTGQRVQAWFTGPVAESYPTQSTAGVLLVLQ